MDEVAAFVREQPIVRFSKDSIMVYQGELPRSLYAIRSGYVKIYDLSGDGSEQLLGLAGKHEFIPSEIIFSEFKPSQFFYAAFTPVEVYAVDRLAFLARITNNSEALLRIVEAVTANYQGQMWHLNAVQKPKAREKIVYVLHYLAAHFGAVEQKRLQEIALPLTQQDIANLVGVTRETAAHELRLLKSQGYITYDKASFMIHDTLANLIV